MPPDRFSPTDFAASKLEGAVGSLLYLELSEIFDFQKIPEEDIATEYLRQKTFQGGVSQTSFASPPSSHRTSYDSASSLSTNNRSSIASNGWDQSSYLARASRLPNDPSYGGQLPLMNQMGPPPPSLPKPYYSGGQQSSIAVGPSDAQQSMHEGISADMTSFGGLSEQPRMVNPSMIRSKHTPKKPIPCPEMGCNKSCTPLSNLEKHMRAQHINPHRIQVHKDGRKHSDAGPKRSGVTNMAADWDEHHKIHHSEYTVDNVNCRSKSSVQNQKLWACGVCRNLFMSFELWLPHYGQHFTKESCTREDVNITNVILGLLEQDKTQAYWHKQRELCYPHSWPFMFTWHEDHVQVRSSMLALSYVHFEDQILEDSPEAQALVDKIIGLSEKV